MARLIAVTSCPTGIAHSMMAAEAIKKTAALMGHEIQVEVHGAEGTTNPPVRRRPSPPPTRC